MKTSIHNLPDDCLLIVFVKINLQSFLSLNQVCRKWNCQTIRRIIFLQHKKLTLITDYDFKRANSVLKPFDPYPFADWADPKSPIRWSWLMRKKISDQFTNGLMRTLQNVTSFSVIMVSHTELDLTIEIGNISKLINFWSNKLLSLKIWTDSETKSRYLDNSETQHNFIQSLNSCTSLRHLSCDCGYLLSNCSNEYILRLPKLEQFNSIRNMYLEELIRLAKTNPNLRSIGLANLIYDEEYAILLSEKIPQQVNEIGLPLDFGKKLLAQLCDRFINLTTLQLIESQLSLPQLTASLSKCTKLNHLILELTLTDHCPQLLNPQKQRQIIQLKSITKLNLKLDGHNHFDLETLYTSWIFPNLEAISINDTNLDCAICGVNVNFGSYSSRERSTTCRVQLLKPLKEIQNLKIIKYHNRVSGVGIYRKEDLHYNLFTIKLA